MNSNKPIPSAKSIEEYLAMVPEDKRFVLENLRWVIKTAAPMAEEMISYRIPSFYYHGPLVYFAAFEKHCSLYVINKSILDIFKSELMHFKTSGTTIHFTSDNPLPDELVIKILKMRIEENETNHDSRK